MRPGRGLFYHFLTLASPVRENSSLVRRPRNPPNVRVSGSLRAASVRSRPNWYGFLSGIYLFPFLNRTMITKSQKYFLGLIIITLLLPIPVTLLIHLVHLSPQFNWIANRTLAGDIIKKQRPQLDVRSWMSGDLQKSVNSLISDHFAGREVLIRVYDQFLYRVFD